MAVGEKKTIEYERANATEKTSEIERANSIEKPIVGERAKVKEKTIGIERAIKSEKPNVGERAKVREKTIEIERANSGGMMQGFFAWVIICMMFSNSPFWVAEPSATYDCDDATLEMVEQCETLGIEYQIVLGNLKLENEKRSQCNHVWLWIEDDEGKTWAFDWGYCVNGIYSRGDYLVDVRGIKIDSIEQWYEGYPITKRELLKESESDFVILGIDKFFSMVLNVIT